MEHEIIDFDMFPPDVLPDGIARVRRRPPARPLRDGIQRRQEAMFFPEAEELC